MRRRLYSSTVLTLSALLSGLAFSDAKPPANGDKQAEAIKAYCIDFNWALGHRRGYAAPGTWKEADPATHVAWYKSVGANVIQTFAVSTNGYAWYKNGVVPEQPGLKHDFLTEMVKLGHAEGMKVMGYFCIGANSRWAAENPSLSYPDKVGYHLPYTDAYLAYLSEAIYDAVKKTGMDGFMIDWVWQPRRTSTNGMWIDSEKNLYKQLMGEDFPGEDRLTRELELSYSRKAIDRAWKTIRKAAKEADPDCIIWLTANKAHHPHVVNSDMYREVDWLMGEAGKNKEILALKEMVGEHTRLITCVSDYGRNDASKTVPEAFEMGIGVYGYAKPDHGRSGIIRLDKIFPKQITELTGNHRRIGTLARLYQGKTLDAVWKNGEFVEPEKPSPYRVVFKKFGRGWSDTSKTTFEDGTVVLSVKSQNKMSRGQLTRKGASWPETICLRIYKKNAVTPLHSHFRIANGSIGMSLIQGENPIILAGETNESVDQKTVWGPDDFLNKGEPERVIRLEQVQSRVTEEFAEVVIPAEFLKNNPEILTFEWCRGPK